MTHLFAILGLSLLSYLFWQQRKQSELAKNAIAHYCKQHNLQLVSVAFGRHKRQTINKRRCWVTLYLFEFSSLGDDCYQGELTMQGFRVAYCHTPAYRIES